MSCGSPNWNGPKDAGQTAFGALAVAEPTPVFQYEFSYNINSKLWNNHSNNGTASIENNMMKLSTGAAANQSAVIESKVPIKYHPGQGSLIRFTGIFTTGVANSEQIIGVGETSDGFFFGYNGADFGILRRVGGNHHVITLTITTKSTTAENITITLDGDSTGANVSVTDATAGDVTTTANDIVSGYDWSTLGSGWEAYAHGDEVRFVSFDSAAHSGSHSISATTAAGTFANTLTGVTPTDNWTAQTSWNKDKCDGTQHLPSMDWTKGNVFEIQYQWLGFGRINFLVEDPSDGEYNVVHTIDYANANTTPTIYNPTLPLYASVKNTSNTSDIILRSASMGCFTEGKTNGGHLHFGISATKTGITTEAPILTIFNKTIYNGKQNRARIKIQFLDIAAEGTKTSNIKFYLNPVLTGASYTEIDANDSIVEYDTSATAATGGIEQFASGLGKSDSRGFNLSTSSFALNPGDHLTLTATSASAVEIDVGINWEEV